VPLPLVVVGAGLLVSYLRGGRLSRIAEADLRWSWLLFAGLGLQIVVDQVTGRGPLAPGQGYGLLLASQLLVLGWVVVNRWRPGMLLILVGLVLNAVVIGANGAMPVAPEAIADIGLAGAQVPPGKHELLTEATRLKFLADIYPLPPLRTIVSIGDVVLAAGLIPLIHHLMTFRPASERRGGSRAPSP
jgi:hypothetical protein